MNVTNTGASRISVAKYIKMVANVISHNIATL